MVLEEAGPKSVELRDAPAEVDDAAVARVSDDFDIHPESLRVESGVLANRDDALDAQPADQLRVQFLNGRQFAHREAAIAQGTLIELAEKEFQCGPHIVGNRGLREIDLLPFLRRDHDWLRQ